MANSQVQIKIEDWVRQHWMLGIFGIRFRRERLRLSAGGFFDFDAVSDDNKIVANISTSSGITSGGKHPAGKVQKLRADMLFLTMITSEKKLIILTEKDMYDLCMSEKKHGRVPIEIDFLLVDLPLELKQRLIAAKKAASDEVTPNPK